MKDGVINQVGTPSEIYERPRNRFVAGFIGSPPMNFMPGHARGHGRSCARGHGDVHRGAARIPAHGGRQRSAQRRRRPAPGAHELHAGRRRRARRLPVRSRRIHRQHGDRPTRRGPTAARSCSAFRAGGWCRSLANTSRCAASPTACTFSTPATEASLAPATGVNHDQRSGPARRGAGHG